MDNNKGSVWVIAEQGKLGILDVSLQLIDKARQLADTLGSPVEVVSLGYQCELIGTQLIAAGADKVYIADDPATAVYQAELYTKIISQLFKQQQPNIVLVGSTFMGRELAPILAATLKTGLTAHCTDLCLDEKGILEQKIPAYGGMMTIVCPEKRPQMATVAKGVFGLPNPDNERTGEILTLEIPNDFKARIRTIEIVKEEVPSISLESADKIVAGGAGAQNIKGWNMIKELANLLGAGLGSTRPAVDEAWIKIDSMIGQSGKMVNPKLYIGIGLSGEQQHMVGIVDSEIMIAINNDEQSPVFSQVDYGIVDDCQLFLPELIKKLKAHQEQ
jgi:electron transfer flavoprotein alpha subunit